MLIFSQSRYGTALQTYKNASKVVGSAHTNKGEDPKSQKANYNRSAIP